MLEEPMFKVTTVLLRLFLAGVILFLLYMKFTMKNRRLVQLGSRIPGPRSLPILGDVLLFAMDPLNSLSIGIDMCDKFNFGPLRFWFFNELVVFVARPDQAEAVLSNVKLFSKPWHYCIFQPFMGLGIFTNNDHSAWKLNRKIITPAFHFNILKGFIPIFFEEASILLKKVKPGEEMDFQNMAGLCALDIICRTAMGVKVHSQSGKGKSFVHGMETVFQIAHTRLTRPWLISDFIFSWSSLKKKHEDACNAVLSFAENVIREKKKDIELKRLNNFNDDPNDSKDHGAFLDIMLGDESDGHMLSDEQLRDETMTLLIGGQETTTTEITFTGLMLALHQDIQTQVLEEIDYVFQGDKSRVPSLEDIQQLHLLERVIKETMRLYPSVPIYARNLEEDMVISGYTMPKGCEVVIFNYGLMRHPKSFPNPDEFNPDNFLPERCRERSPFAYLPFSAGPRNCIGQKYAMIQMKTVLSTILRNYRLMPAGNIRRMEDVSVKMEITLKSRKPVKVIFSPR